MVSCRCIVGFDDFRVPVRLFAGFASSSFLFPCILKVRRAGLKRRRAARASYGQPHLAATGGDDEGRGSGERSPFCSFSMLRSGVLVLFSIRNRFSPFGLSAFQLFPLVSPSILRFPLVPDGCGSTAKTIKYERFAAPNSSLLVFPQWALASTVSSWDSECSFLIFSYILMRFRFLGVLPLHCRFR